jgi:N-acetylneuraminate synthase
MSYCNKKNIIFFSSVCSEDITDFLEKQNVQLFKTTSYAITHLPLLKHIAKKQIPLIFSTGGATINEIKEAYNTVKEYNHKLIILHCVIKYPAPLKTINMNVLDTLKAEFPNVIIGYSDHTLDPCAAPITAIYKGAKVIEKHITLDKEMKGPDHFFALEPKELKEMVKAIRDAEKTLKLGGSLDIGQDILGSSEKIVNQDELYLKSFSYCCIFAAKSIKKGEEIKKEDLLILRPGNKKRGLDPKFYNKITSGDYISIQDINPEDPISWENVKLMGES